MSSNGTETMTPLSERRLVAGFIYMILNLFGTCGNTLVIVVLIVRSSAFSSYTFYSLVMALACGDLIFLLVNWSMQVPETLFGALEFYEKVPLLHEIINAFQTIAFGWLFMASFLIAVDRFTVFVLPHVAAVTFDNVVRMRVIALGGPAAFGGLLAIMTWSTGCNKEFQADNFYWFYDCGNQTDGLGRLWLSTQGYTVNIMASVMLVLYVFVYVYLQMQSSNSLSNKSDARVHAERSLLTQGMIISGSAILQVGSFWLNQKGFMKIFGWGSAIIMQVIAIINSSINPIVYAIFNKLIREQTLKMFGYRSASVRQCRLLLVHNTRRCKRRLKNAK